ncbi:MAG: hypothetical protein A2725_02395 [Candidatus Magasanikbacteria bacterium RIFCSPHIGHO2_01_FULL_33_34]|uniref:Cold-shock protein n=1 Tax=Candidatus Magasanikbacteria bacterium RIFCSPHIGHO2_01_FULL_33_34 TaxID=1798671 RepID=A0A1F6LKB9_9BACT|nr:MAG: hypothetical protein A2725_02395 [Candidatus Magasanikbacteria bacterium RIFCSPHIGHO2_01_FULL_33_34]OGH65629.1 MAG: hypothetical protein A3B83_02005 [Candidatus Magasanikbacteria bacterium RIFCSPHIGHO2_02_FULL_33_17]OGH75838.1 MAG: hypothetical protein A3A89_02900 [Candidatus Magasanikbacteria bacterium RIFCSPLOWO2_01_FULL_33_34]OGH81150.1 MAG: hypothetical protein A3F93_01750 [Candidatus Magasanikbacteria bacterium RIFCSPLOWO2_12_FULL_34_7]
MKWFLSLNILTQILLIYFIIINIIAFFFFGLDKLKSQLNKQRISEKNLWLLALIGGSAGSLLAMNFFRHKTQKTSFQIVFVLILLIQITSIVLILNKYN